MAVGLENWDEEIPPFPCTNFYSSLQVTDWRAYLTVGEAIQLSLPLPQGSMVLERLVHVFKNYMSSRLTVHSY